MARTFLPTMAHQPPQRPAAPKPVASRPAPGRPPHGKPHPARRPGHGGLVTALLIGATILAGAAWYVLTPQTNATDPSEALLAQMQAAAEGNVTPTHALGGTLSASRADGHTTVTATALPAKACVQVGWRLSKEGIIMVNGILPPRLSAARLSELCNGEGGAVLVWMPEE